jgi:hypothetical protein
LGPEEKNNDGRYARARRTIKRAGDEAIGGR